MIQKTDIIYFSLFRWNNPYSSVSLSLAKEFSQNNRVFYVNHPISYKDLVKGWTNNTEVRDIKWNLLKGGNQFQQIDHYPNITSVTPELSYPINWLSKGSLYDFFKKKNEQIIQKAIEETIEKYNIKKYIFINCFDPFFVDILPKDKPPILSVYQCIDDISQNKYTSRHGTRLEIESAKKYDITVTTSRQLKRLMKQHTPETHILHNAADIKLFRNAVEENYPRPKEIENISTKIIGFTGNMDAVRINYPLLKQIATEHTDKTLLLIGPVNSPEVKDLEIDQLPNVILTGSKPITELPKYLQHCDCVIIPFLCNTLTASIYPLKINEYLAAGKSVVSSNFSEDIRTFDDQIKIANSDDEFVQLIHQAILENAPEQIEARQAVAATNTWTARVERFWKIVRAFQQKNQKEISANI